MTEKNITLIPAFMLIKDLTFSHFDIFDHRVLELSRNTLKNIKRGKGNHKKNTIKKFVSAVDQACSEFEGLTVDTDLLAGVLKKSPQDTLIEMAGEIFDDEFSRYTHSVFQKLFLREHDVFTNLKKLPERSKMVFSDIKNTIKFSGDMISYNLPKSPHSQIEGGIIFLNRIWADELFYFMAARDVEENFRFYRKIRNNKSLASAFLPTIQNNKIKYPMALLLDKIIIEQEYASINEFALSIPQLSKTPKEQQNDQTKKRLIRRYLNGERFPSREFVEIMSDTIFKSKLQEKSTDPEDIYEVREQAISVFWYIKLFHDLLKKMLENQKSYGLDRIGVINFFRRYLHWHKYHTIHFEANQSGHGGE